MKLRSLLGLCLSGSLLLAGQAALADKNDKEKSNNRSERAVQVHIDKETGRKMSASDDSVAAVEATEPVVVDLSGRLPAETEPPQYHSNGMVSIKTGAEHLKYLVVTIDEDGNKSFVHQRMDDVDLNAKADKGEE